MAITYEEFDTTVGGLVAALQTKIVAHADWDVFTPTGVPTFTNTASISSAATSFTASSVAGLFVGQRIKWTVSSVAYTRTITDIVGTTISFVTAIGVTTPITTTFNAEVNLVKATTTRGAEMIVDIQAGSDSSELNRLNLRFWRSLPSNYSTATMTEFIDRFVYWRTSGGSLSHNLHVTLSVGKEHLFIGIEGPRWNEPGPISTTYGSFKNYAFISDVVPYHAADTAPFVAVGASGSTSGAAATTLNGAHEIDVSRNYANTTSWTSGRLGTLSFPSIQSTQSVILQRDCSIDSKTYLFPYVLLSNSEGMRGRLARLFNAGMTHPSPAPDIGDPVGSKVTFDGVTYKLLSVNKSEGNTFTWGTLGATGNDNTIGTYRSVVVAVPFSE